MSVVAEYFLNPPCNLPARLIKSLSVKDHSHPTSRHGKDSVMLGRVFRWTSTHREAQPIMNAPNADQLLSSPPRKRTVRLWGRLSLRGTLPHDQKQAQGSGLPSPASPVSDWSLDKQLEAIQSGASLESWGRENSSFYRVCRG